MKRVSWLKAGHSNTIFSVRDIVSGTDGAVLQSYNYRENGEKTTLIPTGPKSDKTWVGGLSVNDDTADSGLYLMGHRHYDATLGRFLSRDPIGFDGGLNLYEYAGSSPVTYTDPDGLKFVFDKSLSPQQIKKVQGWINLNKKEGSPIRGMMLKLETDPRAINIKNWSNNSSPYPAHTFADLKVRKNKQGKNEAYATSATMEIDFSKLGSRQVQTECGGKTELVIGHEFGHAYHAMFYSSHAMITAKVSAAGVSFDGISADEVVARHLVEEPYRKFLKLPATLDPATIKEADAFMKAKTPFGLTPPGWKLP